MIYFIVEHRSRGCFLRRDDYTRKPKFAWSGSRVDPKVHKFTTPAEAKPLLAEVKGSYLLRVDPSAKGGDYIRQVEATA